MKIRRKTKRPPIQVTFSGKEAKAMVKEVEQIGDLYRYASADFETPYLDEFIDLLERAIDNPCF